MTKKWRKVMDMFGIDGKRGKDLKYNEGGKKRRKGLEGKQIPVEGEDRTLKSLNCLQLCKAAKCVNS